MKTKPRIFANERGSAFICVHPRLNSLKGENDMKTKTNVKAGSYRARGTSGGF